MNTFAEKIYHLLKEKSRIVVVSHPNPDGDALGSSLGLRRILLSLGHEVYFVSPTNYSGLLAWIPDVGDTLCWEKATQQEQIDKLLSSCHLLFCLDFNAISRLEELGSRVKQSNAIKILIDHHQQPEPFADWQWSDTAYPSTSEMIFDLADYWGMADAMDKETAVCLYTGMATDTGFFQYSNTRAHTLHVASRLLALGVKPDIIADQVFHVFSEKRFRLFGHCIGQKLQLILDGRVAYMTISPKEAYIFNIQQGDTEGLVNYPFKIKGVQLCVLFVEEKERIKISFRSKGKLDVNQYARTYFQGGGHVNAAGAKSIVPLAETLALFTDTIHTVFPTNANE